MNYKDFEKEVIELGNQHSLTLTLDTDENIDKFEYGIISIKHNKKIISRRFKYKKEDWIYVLDRVMRDINYYVMNLKNYVTRLEIIDENGRSYSKWNIEKIEYSIQDNGKTLKIFLK